jgi:paraquat-inducible protein A
MRPIPSPVLRECPDCGLLQYVAVPPLRHAATCERCDAVLWRRRSDPTERALAMGVVALVCYLLLVSTPLLSVEVGGRERVSGIISLPLGFDQRGMPLLAVLVLGTIIAAPLVRIALTVIVLGGVRRSPARPAVLAHLARLRGVLAPWSMPEVFLLGVFVAYTRLSALAPAQLGIAGFALGALVLAKVATEVLLDEHMMWERISPSPPASSPLFSPGPPRWRLIACTSCGLLAEKDEGSPCPRCGAALHRRRRASVARAWALLAAAAVLYGPANFLPIMTITRYARAQDYTILGGVEELVKAGQWPLALLVFTASICVPVLKIIGMLVLLISTHLHASACLHDRTRLYRVVEVIGRWSMIDVFMISILTALVQMGALANVVPHAGAQCFAAVVVLTMLSVASFDPRLMWDAAERRAAQPASRGERQPA